VCFITSEKNVTINTCLLFEEPNIKLLFNSHLISTYMRQNQFSFSISKLNACLFVEIYHTYFTNALTLLAPCTHNFKQCKRYVTPFPGNSPDLNILNYCNCTMTHLISTQCLPKDCKERGVHTIAIKDIQMVPATFSGKFF